MPRAVTYQLSNLLSQLTTIGRSPARWRAGFCRQAARTECKNFPTSSLSRLLSPDSDCAAESTCDEAEPVSLAPRCTSVMLEETCWVPCAACWTLREISW